MDCFQNPATQFEAVLWQFFFSTRTDPRFAAIYRHNFLRFFTRVSSLCTKLLFRPVTRLSDAVLQYGLRLPFERHHADLLLLQRFADVAADAVEHGGLAHLFMGAPPQYLGGTFVLCFIEVVTQVAFQLCYPERGSSSGISVKISGFGCSFARLPFTSSFARQGAARISKFGGGSGWGLPASTMTPRRPVCFPVRPGKAIHRNTAESLFPAEADPDEQDI